MHKGNSGGVKSFCWNVNAKLYTVDSFYLNFAIDQGKKIDIEKVRDRERKIKPIKGVYIQECLSSHS